MTQAAKLWTPIQLGSDYGSLVLVAVTQTDVIVTDAGSSAIRYCRFSAPVGNTDSIFLSFEAAAVVVTPGQDWIIELPPGGDTGEVMWGGPVSAYTVAGGTLNYLTALNYTDGI